MALHRRGGEFDQQLAVTSTVRPVDPFLTCRRQLPQKLYAPPYPFDRKATASCAIARCSSCRVASSVRPSCSAISACGSPTIRCSVNTSRCSFDSPSNACSSSPTISGAAACHAESNLVVWTADNRASVFVNCCPGGWTTLESGCGCAETTLKQPPLAAITSAVRPTCVPTGDRTALPAARPSGKVHTRHLHLGADGADLRVPLKDPIRSVSAFVLVHVTVAEEAGLRALRISPHVFTTFAEVDRLAGILVGVARNGV